VGQKHTIAGEGRENVGNAKPCRGTKLLAYSQRPYYTVIII